MSLHLTPDDARNIRLINCRASSKHPATGRRQPLRQWLGDQWATSPWPAVLVGVIATLVQLLILCVQLNSK